METKPTREMLEVELAEVKAERAELQGQLDYLQREADQENVKEGVEELPKLKQDETRVAEAPILSVRGDETPMPHKMQIKIGHKDGHVWMAFSEATNMIAFNPQEASVVVQHFVHHIRQMAAEEQKIIVPGRNGPAIPKNFDMKRKKRRRKK